MKNTPPGTRGVFHIVQRMPSNLFAGVFAGNPLLRRTRLLVGAMHTSNPATWPALTLSQLFTRTTNPSSAGLWFLGVLDPTDELIACERSDVFPGGFNLWP